MKQNMIELKGKRIVQKQQRLHCPTFFMMWGIEPRASHMLCKCSTIKLNSSPNALLSEVNRTIEQTSRKSIRNDINITVDHKPNNVSRQQKTAHSSQYKEHSPEKITC